MERLSARASEAGAVRRKVAAMCRKAGEDFHLRGIDSLVYR